MKEYRQSFLEARIGLAEFLKPEERPQLLEASPAD
jgi:hypothetical protein